MWQEKVGAWVNICRPVVEGIIGVWDFSDIRRSLLMKFAWRLISKHNLWTAFFRAKYIKEDHLICTLPNRKGSNFWKVIYKVIPEVYDNCYTWIGKGQASFWFDKWLVSCPLVINVLALNYSWLKDSNSWNIELPKECVGEEKTNMILACKMVCKQGKDRNIWKSNRDGFLATGSTCKTIWVRANQHEQMKWIWHNSITKNVSLCL